MNLNKKILSWFDIHGRKDLPWQHNPTPYRVWISEIMLQQTQVSTVIPYYQRFMETFPNISSLAKAKLDKVLHLWAGLGYYARARNLHKAAKVIQEHFNGEFPTNYKDCVALPGIGPSTAGAILALSQEQRLPILDGNVKRVLARHFAIHGNTNEKKIETKLWEIAKSLLPKARMRDYTQALMDLGATLCTRTTPKCLLCPIQKTCQALLTDQVAMLPTAKKSIIKPNRQCNFLIYFDPCKKAVLLEKRENKGIWGGLWSFPEIQHIPKYAQLFSEFTHIFTHFKLNIAAYFCCYQLNKTKIKAKIEINSKKHFWQVLTEKPKLGLSAPIQKLLKELQCHELCSA